MNHFQTFSSNSIAGSGNQFYFRMDKDEVRVGRVFYKVTHGGTFRYSILFTNILDSTFADGKISQKNMPCKPWTIYSAHIGRADADIFTGDAMHHNDANISFWCNLTFDGKTQKQVASGETFWCDPTELSFEDDDYLCLELTFSGETIPYHEESLLPAFVFKDGEWTYCKELPFAGMIGCDRNVKHRIAFWGDSITQGIGTPINSYAHWNAHVAKKLGADFACWNLGIGYARANDAASLGAWWEKAIHADTVVLCLGANDILQDMPEEQIKHDLKTIVCALKEQEIRVVLQTVPPFEYASHQISVWKNVNDYIRTELASEADLLFDIVPHLSDGEPNHLPRFGGHPNEEGCEIWANALYEKLKKLL